MTRQPGTIETTTTRTCKCKKCETIISKGELAYKIVTTSTYYYMCDRCHNRILPYSTKNDQVNNKACKHGITLGLEHEQSGAFDYRALYVQGWYPTSDCTVNVEYKSPIFNSLRGLKLTLETLERANATSGDNRSGTHCHIGTFDYRELSAIQSNCNQLFDSLQSHLSNDQSGTIAFFGRYFSGYCNLTSAYNGHSSWLNLYTGKPTVELRLGKFISAKQYYRVLIFSRLFGSLLKDFTSGKTSAIKTSNKILALYRKCRLARDISDIIGNNNRD